MCTRYNICFKTGVSEVQTKVKSCVSLYICMDSVFILNFDTKVVTIIVMQYLFSQVSLLPLIAKISKNFDVQLLGFSIL